MSSTREKATLTGVSETALLTLRGRAREARRPDGVITDPMAVRLADSIDFDYAKFGPARQDFGLRAVAFDIHTRHYLRRHPSATVVALAEGLQTSFWRLDAAVADGQFRWLTVDLEPVIDLRKRLLPASPRISMCAQVRAGLQLDGARRPVDRGVHHRAGLADVSAARGSPRIDRRVRQAVSRRRPSMTLLEFG